MDEQRSHQARALAELALVRLLHALRSMRTTFIEVRERYMRTTGSGPIGYAEQALEVEPDADTALLRADAVDVVQRFFATLGI
jgi:hypothetical protein